MLNADLRTYQTLYEAMEKPRLYHAPWWLDATCGPGGWSVLLLHGSENTLLGLPYLLTRIRGLTAVITPHFSQWVSPVGPDPDPSLFPKVLTQLPACSILDLCFLPWGGGVPEELPSPVQLKYTYVIPDHVNPDTCRSLYNEGLRRNLKAAEAQYTIRPSEDIHLFLSLCASSYRQRGEKAPRWLDDVVPRVYHALRARSAGEIILAFDGQQAVAGIMTATDTHSMYYLAGGRDDQAQSLSAHSLLLDHAIHSALRQRLEFDFEGSMHPGIANFFQAFGSVPKPYWQIRRFRGLGRWWSLFH